MSAETRTIAVQAYRDKDGEPTCAADFSKGYVCRFYGTSKLGCEDVCLATTKQIQRRVVDSWSLIPVEGCPVWSGE